MPDKPKTPRAAAAKSSAGSTPAKPATRKKKAPAKPAARKARPKAETSAKPATKASAKATANTTTPKRGPRKASPRKRTAAAPPQAPTHDQIAHEAYLIWQTAGCPSGHEMIHWLEAERRLLHA